MIINLDLSLFNSCTSTATSSLLRLVDITRLEATGEYLGVEVAARSRSYAAGLRVLRDMITY